MGFIDGRTHLRDTEPTIEGLRDIVESHEARTMHGVGVDVQTAHALVVVYDGLKPENQTRFEQTLAKDESGLERLVRFAWQNVAGKEGT